MSSVNIARAESTTIDRQWVDDTWRDHILWRAEVLSSSPNSIYTEGFCRDVQRLDPGNLRSLGILTQVYAMKGETALLAMCSLVALDLYPTESFFKHTLERADERISGQPVAPTDEELAIETNQFNVYFRDAIRTRQVDKNLMISEIELRVLLSKYPLNLNVLQELSITYRLAEEWTMSAMVNRLAMREYPENRAFLYDYIESLHRMGKDDVAWKIATGEFKTHTDEAELLQLITMLSIAVEQQDSLPYYLKLFIGGGTNVDTFVELARSLMSKMQFPSAILVLEYAHGMDPARYEPVYDLAVINSVMKNDEERMRWLSKLQKRVDPDEFENMIHSGPFPPNTLEGIVNQ